MRNLLKRITCALFWHRWNIATGRCSRCGLSFADWLSSNDNDW